MFADAQQEYTLDDHAARESDVYALTKYEITLRWLTRRFGALRGKTLFNIGCGAGEFNRQAHLAGAEVSGFEPDPETFKMAVENNRSTSAVRLRQCGVLEIEPETHRPEIIVMHDVLEHIQDDHEAAKHLARLVKPGGTVILSVPAMPSLFGLHDELLKHYRRYTIASLRAVVEPHFRIRRIRYFGAAFVPIVYWYSVKKRAAYPVDESRRGIGALLMNLICWIESFIPMPIGISILAELESK